MEKNNVKGFHKYCIVPMCRNTSSSNPGILFFSVPRRDEIRSLWCQIVKREPLRSSVTNRYCCEDHFDIEQDMVNYWQCKLFGAGPRLKPEVVPHKFACQKSQNSLVVKRPRTANKRQSGVNLASKQELQSDELIPETSFQQPEGYLPEHTPSSRKKTRCFASRTPCRSKRAKLAKARRTNKNRYSHMPAAEDIIENDRTNSTVSINIPSISRTKSPVRDLNNSRASNCSFISDSEYESQTEETTNRPPEKKYYSSKVYCRMCLESIVAKAQMVPLTLMDINFPAKNAAFKQKKEMETYRITNMIQVVMPDFDFNAAYNPIVCIKCITRLESAYNFIRGCQENEKLIHLYKSKYCPNLELVSCEDVAKNKSLLMDQPSTRKRRKTSNRHINTEAVSESLVEQSVGQLEERSNTELASDTSQVGHYEMVFASSSGYQDNLAPETSVELPSSIKCETEDYDGYGDDSHILINPEEVSSIVKEEIVVKEEVSGNFTDTSNNERVDQLEMDYHVKEEKDEDCLQPDSGMSHIDDYHKNSPQYPPTNQMSLTFNRPKT